MAAKIKRDDTVQVLQGRDRGRRGEVRAVSPSTGRALGNRPQAYSHLGLISNALNLAAAERD